MSVLASPSVETTVGPVSHPQDTTPSAVSYIPPALPNEKVLYQDNHVLVSPQRFVAGIRTYAVQSITSSEVRKLTTRKWPVYLVMAAGVAFCSWLLTFWPLMSAIVLLVVALCVVGLLISIRPNYVLHIATNQGETDALMSRDRVYIQRANDALNNVLNK